jgi:predicted metal-dependent hydrolase
LPTQGYVFYQERKLPYTLINDKKLKNFYIQITPQKGVIVKNPGYSIKKVENLLQMKAAWIFKNVSLLNNRLSIQKIYEEENKILLFGKKQALHVENLEKFYKEKTQEIIQKIVDEYSSKMNLFPTKIGFRKAKRRWGSCSHNNALSFNTSLAQLPLECITYIVIHELAHIKHKNHQKSFWLLVQDFCPSYKKYDKEIKNYSPSFSLS